MWTKLPLVPSAVMAMDASPVARRGASPPFRRSGLRPAALPPPGSDCAGGAGARTEVTATASLDGRDALDLDVELPRPRPDRHEGAGGRVVGEVAGVHLVDAGEVRRVRDEHGDLDDLVERGAGRLQRRLHVLEHLLGLCDDVAADQLPGLWIDG